MDDSIISSPGTAKNQVPHRAIAAFLVASNAWHVFCAVARWNLEILHVCTCAYFLCHWWFLSLRFEDLWRFDHKPNEITLSTKRLRALPIPSNNDQTRSAPLYSSKNSQIQFFYPTQNNTSLFFQLHRPIFKPARCGFVGTSRLSLSMHITQVDVGPGRWWIFYPQGFQPFRIELNGVFLAVVQKKIQKRMAKNESFQCTPDLIMTWDETCCQVHRPRKLAVRSRCGYGVVALIQRCKCLGARNWCFWRKASDAMWHACCNRFSKTPKNQMINSSVAVLPFFWYLSISEAAITHPTQNSAWNTQLSSLQFGQVQVFGSTTVSSAATEWPAATTRDAATPQWGGWIP